MAASMILRSSEKNFLRRLFPPYPISSVSRFSTASDNGSESEEKTSKFSFSLDDGLDLKKDEVSKETTTTEQVTPQESEPAPVVTFSDNIAKQKQVHKHPDIEKPKTFASMLRRSTLMMLGDFKGARLQGHIIEVQDNDLYIDFGGKFYCVCPRPEPKSEYYKGRLVDIQLLEWEMSQKFIGSEKHITLLEADAILLGLSKSRKGVTISEEEAVTEETLPT